MNEEDAKMLLQEMQWVRKLLMLQAFATGYKQKHLAAALGVSDATMSRMLPKGFAKDAKQMAGGRAVAGAVEE